MIFGHVIRLMLPSNSTDAANLTASAFVSAANIAAPFWHLTFADVPAITVEIQQLVGIALGLVLIFVNIMAYRRRARQDRDHPSPPEI